MFRLPRLPSALLISAAACLLVGFLMNAAEGEEASPRVKKLGLIGLDTSHAIAFTDIINDPKADGVLAEFQVVAGYPNGMPDNPFSWDRVGGYTEQLRQKGLQIFDSIEAMLPHVDAVLIESVDGRPHLEQARKVIAARKPMFIDKPMAASLRDVILIFRLAEEANVPVFSSSSLRFSSGFQAVRKGEAGFGQIKRCLAWSPMSIEPHHPDLFWYGIHGVETLYTIMGTGCQTVVRESQNRVVGTWKDGRVGIFEERKGYGAEVEGTEKSGSAGSYEGYKPLVVEICNFFKTGVSPVPKEETIELFAFMEAADVSKQLGGKPVAIADVLAKAQAEAEKKYQELKSNP
ncbi:Gfo/Idh/MocA family oxidoreductase [Thermogutta sp.]|uniref:Gfo/Idh/MocA family oxidoreductase n=1 Tax=Thermogutta sp. TaxID=1962930 RepID=UPI003C7E5491